MFASISLCKFEFLKANRSMIFIYGLRIDNIAAFILQYEAIAFTILPVATLKNFSCLKVKFTFGRIGINNRIILLTLTATIDNCRLQGAIMIIFDSNRSSNVPRVRNATRQRSALMNRINKSLTGIFKRIANLAINYVWLVFANIFALNFFAVYAHQGKSIELTLLPIATSQNLACAKLNLTVSRIAVHNRIKPLAFPTSISNIKVQTTFAIVGRRYGSGNVAASLGNTTTHT